MDDIIVIEDLWWKYQDSDDWALKKINLKVKRNEFLAITGPTGAGKSSLCMCLNGLIPQNFIGKIKGNVEIDGLNARKTEIYELAKKVGMVFQDPESQFIGMTVEEDIVFGLENMKTPLETMHNRLNWALDVVRMQKYSNRAPYDLSGGQKQRVGIASALAMMSEVIVLDEPTSELDPIGKMEVFSVIEELQQKHDRTIILVEHLTEELVKYADRILLLDDGEIKLIGTPAEFFSEEELLIKHGVYPPPVASFFNRLKKEGHYKGVLPLTVKQAYKELGRYFGGKSQ